MNLNDLLAIAENKLKDIHPFLSEKAKELIKLSYEKGIYIIITQGLRTTEEQNKLYAQGRTTKGNIVTNVKGGYSYHNYGLAFDFAIVDKTGKQVYWNTNIDTNRDGLKDWYQVGEIGQNLGLEWGGSWKSFIDIPHFQYTFGLTTAQLRAGKKPPTFVKPQDKLMWGRTEFKKGQIGKLTILKPINLWKDNNRKLEMVRILQPKEEYRVYGYRNDHGGQYDVGGGHWVTKMPEHIKYETPSKSLLAKAKEFYK